MKIKKSPLPGRERVGERVTVKKYPLPSIPSRQGRGNNLLHYLLIDQVNSGFPA
jgi:hypothetical protein